MSTEAAGQAIARDVFISYARADRDRALELIERLRESGVTVWVDESAIDGATRWSQEIVQAITSCKVFLCVASKRSFESENVAREITIASEERKPILPVYLEPVQIPASIRYQLVGIQHERLYGDNVEQAFAAILHSLRRYGVRIRAGARVKRRRTSRLRARDHAKIALFAALLASIVWSLRDEIDARVQLAIVAAIAALVPVARKARKRGSERWALAVERSYRAVLATPVLIALALGAAAAFAFETRAKAVVAGGDSPWIVFELPETSARVQHARVELQDAASGDVLGTVATQGRRSTLFRGSPSDEERRNAEIEQRAAADPRWRELALGPLVPIARRASLRARLVALDGATGEPLIHAGEPLVLATADFVVGEEGLQWIRMERVE